MDLIERKKAIDAVKEEWDGWSNEYDAETIVSYTCEALERLPSAQPEVLAHGEGELIAQPEQRWIPCSERLPDIGERNVSEPCIVYCSNGAYGFAGLEENIFGQVGWNCERDDEYHEPLGEVLAWMPLPERYEGGEE